MAASVAKLLAAGKAPPERVPVFVETLCRQGGAGELKVVWDQVHKAGALPPLICGLLLLVGCLAILLESTRRAARRR